MIKEPVKCSGKYKQTEVGLIPEDWDLFNFSDVMSGFSSGQTPYRAIKDYYNGEIPWITSGELNYNIIKDTIEKITSDAVAKTNLKLIPMGTFLMAITGLEAAGTRGSCAITGIEATTNQSCMALYPIKGKLTTEYLYHYYVRYGDSLAFKYCQGTKQQSYTARIAKTLPIIVPNSIKEQTAIAKALSDADAMIASLEKLIEKKKKIKQGAMQELLSSTGSDGKLKKGWVKRKLGEVCSLITKGTTPTSIGKAFTSAGINFIKIESLNNDGSILADKVAYIDEDTHMILSRSQLKAGDVLFSIAGALGRVSIVSADLLPANTNQALSIIRLKEDSGFNSKFLYYYLIQEHVQREILTNSVQGAQANLSLKDINEIEISYPREKVDQEKIISTLSDLDNLIIVLHQKLGKALELKQGMMQNLLTGKIRLV